MITDKTISLDAIRTLAETSLDTKRALQTMYPDVFRMPMKVGNIVSKEGDSAFLFGVVAGPTVSELVNKHFGYGLFVIVHGISTSSYTDETAAADAGWKVVLVQPRG